MITKEIKVETITDLKDAPGWIEMTRAYLSFAVVSHENATGQRVDAEEQLQQTLATIDEFLGPDGRFITARRLQGDLVGMVLLHRLANGKGEVKRLYVLPEMRGTGLARILMNPLEDEARSMGLRALYLDTSSGLIAAIKFYKRLGFKDAFFDPDSVQDPEIARHLVILEKPLTT